MTQRVVVKRALISVYDKSGLVEFAQKLASAGVEIVSTGSTASVIAQAGIPVTPVHEVTGFPECLDGRVKTLHPHIHGGLLADLRKESHGEQLRELGIQPFELVVVNLYPFASTVASGAGVDDCVEQIDIGGPAMVRASAKNYANVCVVVSPHRYESIADMVSGGGIDRATRAELAAEAFAHTATYDSAVANWMYATAVGEAGGPQEEFAPWAGQAWLRKDVLRYGENPHQHAAVYVTGNHVPGIASAEQLHGKQMSYNNYVDADAARRAASDFLEPAVAIIKHANPCGIAVGLTIEEAYEHAHATDPVSAFGGVIAANRVVTEEMARKIADVFTEVIVAPDFEPQALTILQEKKNIRILKVGSPHPGKSVEIRSISGGMLMQDVDDVEAPGDDPSTWTLVAGPSADPALMRSLEFAWRACRAVKSNAILLAHGTAAVGVGMGQVSRVDSARLAVARAGDRAAGSVAASDAFFPFADGLQVLIDAGVTAVVQPGGSVRDEEVVAAAAQAGVSMYFTGTRHFFH